jgi:hypothetical protein
MIVLVLVMSHPTIIDVTKIAVAVVVVVLEMIVVDLIAIMVGVIESKISLVK